MTQSDGQIIIQVTLDDKEAKKGLDGIDKATGKLDKESVSKFKNVAKGVTAVGTAALGAVGLIVGVGAAIGGLATPLVQAAAQAQAMNAQFDQVFEELQGQAQSTIDSLGTQFGMLSERIKPAFTTMSSMFMGLGLDTETAMGTAERAVTAVADAAAFYDMSFENANSALNSFIKGNYEGGEAIGLFANETQLATWASQNLGQEWKNLGEADKQLARLEFAEAMMTAGGAAGQAARESGSLENQLGNLKQAWENLKALLGAPLLEPAIAGIQLLTSVIQSFDTSFITTAFENLKNSISSNSEAIRGAAEQAFNGLKSVIESVLNVVVPFVQSQVDKIKQFWSENGQQILQAVTNAFNGVKAVIDFIMPAIQFVVDYVWTAIKDIISGAIDVILGVVKTFSSLFTGDWEGLWDGIKQLLSGAVDLIMGIMSLNFLGGIRKVFADLLESGIKYVRNMWDDIVLKFQGAKDDVIAKAQGLKDDFVKKVIELKDEAVKKAGDLKDEFVGKVKEIDLLQVGKDIIQGLINGIGNKFGDVRKKVEDLAAQIPEWAKKVLGINSPSKRFIEIGEGTGEGLEIGIANSHNRVVKAAKTLAAKTIDGMQSASPSKVFVRMELN